MVLLDANVLIWWMKADPRLGKQAKTLLASDAALGVSLLTIFEIELKVRAGKLRLDGSVSDFLDQFGVEVHVPSPGELRQIMQVKLHHSDPFDCALIGTAALKGWPAMTSDEQLCNGAERLVQIIDSRK